MILFGLKKTGILPTSNNVDRPIGYIKGIKPYTEKQIPNDSIHIYNLRKVLIDMGN